MTTNPETQPSEPTRVPSETVRTVTNTLHELHALADHIEQNYQHITGDGLAELDLIRTARDLMRSTLNRMTNNMTSTIYVLSQPGRNGCTRSPHCALTTHHRGPCDQFTDATTSCVGQTVE